MRRMMMVWPLLALLAACGESVAPATDAGPDPWGVADAAVVLERAELTCVDEVDPVCLVRAHGVISRGDRYGVEPVCADGELECFGRELRCACGGEPCPAPTCVFVDD